LKGVISDEKNIRNKRNDDDSGSTATTTMTTETTPNIGKVSPNEFVLSLRSSTSVPIQACVEVVVR